MSKATGYSLWLVPKRNSEAYKFLDLLIRNVAEKYQTPRFEPHVTLLGGVGDNDPDILKKTEVLAEKLAPYEIQLGEIDSNRTYFQILFSKIKQSPEVMNANIIAQRVFGMNSGTYFPHLSFAYGDLPSEQVTVLQKFVIQERHRSEISFPANDVELWRTEGAVKEWYRVAKVPFVKS